MPTEAQLVSEILRTFGATPGVRIWRNNTGCAQDKTGRVIRFGVVGQADISGILLGGRRLEIEAKTASGRQTEQQKRFQAMIEQFGGIYILARSVDDVRRALP